MFERQRRQGTGVPRREGVTAKPIVCRCRDCVKSSKLSSAVRMGVFLVVHCVLKHIGSHSIYFIFSPFGVFDVFYFHQSACARGYGAAGLISKLGKGGLQKRNSCFWKVVIPVF